MIIKNLEELEQMDIWKLRDYANKLGLQNASLETRSSLIEKCVNLASASTAKDASVSADEQKVKRGRGRPRKENIEQPKTAVELDKNSTLPTKSTKPIESNEDKAVKGGDKSYKKHSNVLQEGNTYGQKQERVSSPQYGDRKSGLNKPKPPYAKDRDNREGSYNNRERQQASSTPAEATNSTEELAVREGVLDICVDGYGFLRAVNYQNGESDAYIASQKIKRYGLRKGDYVVATVKKIEENRPWGVQEVKLVNGEKPENLEKRARFESLTPIHPDSRIKLELDTIKSSFAMRAMDLVSPIGKGQRGMIVSPPKAGKTTLLKSVAKSISMNYPEAHLIVLLIDERPEEVTDMQRSITGEVVYSTFDELPDHHIKVTELVLERAKRMVEMGKDVVILLDSLTRLTRAYNLVINPTGKILSGGIDPGAFYGPKKFFGAARNIENGGSLTILATALVDTGSRMDDVVYEEFKGTGNMEVHLDRKLAERRIFPAIDLYRSGTRREELLLNKEELECAIIIRNMMSSGDNVDATENLVGKILKSKTNRELCQLLMLETSQFEKRGYKRILN